MPPGRRTAIPALLAAGLWLTAVGWGIRVNRRWTRTLTGDRRDGTLVVVLLGFRNAGTRINAVNRARVRMAVRTVAAAVEAGTPPAAVRLVCSGAAVGSVGGPSEARLLADHACRLGHRRSIELEEASRTTWENVTEAVPLLQDADRIAFVSQPAHALKARAYLGRQRPDLSDRLVMADGRLGAWTLLAPVLAVHGCRSLRALSRAERGSR